MKREELEKAVAIAAGIASDELTVKKRPGNQIKSNGLWEGSCSPTEERKKVGLFLADGGEDLAVDGAERRLTLQVPYPDSIVVISKPSTPNQRIEVVGYPDSANLDRLATVFNTKPVLVDRPPIVGHRSIVSEDPSTLRLEDALAQVPNVVLQGPPGTGKTSLALELVRRHAERSSKTMDDCRFGQMVARYDRGVDGLLEDVDVCRSPPIVWEFVQLHPTYSYDDLVRRMRPITQQDGQLQLTVEDGLLPQLCRLAEIRGDELPVMLILDEINRGNLANVLGEFVFAIDPGHRGTPVRLQYQSAGLSPSVSVPKNLWIVGTMNTADRSIALIDFAIRRRFRFIDVPASDDVFRRWYGEERGKANVATDVFNSCNDDLPMRLRVGHAIFLVDPSPSSDWPERMARRVVYHVFPLLAEYEREGLRVKRGISLFNVDYDLESQRVNEDRLAVAFRSRLAL
jgi:5-methylcytosine-specific restriction protein B